MSSALQDIRAKLIGAWRLLSWYEKGPGGEIVYPLGNDAQGQLIYTVDGLVSAQLMRANVHSFANDDWRQATLEERAEAWLGYFGYFGTFSIDEERSVVIHHVEGSWFPNLKGTHQTRFFHFDGESLVLDAETAWGNVRIVWERAVHNGSMSQ